MPEHIRPSWSAQPLVSKALVDPHGEGFNPLLVRVLRRQRPANDMSRPFVSLCLLHQEGIHRPRQCSRTRASELNVRHALDASTRLDQTPRRIETRSSFRTVLSPRRQFGPARPLRTANISATSYEAVGITKGELVAQVGQVYNQRATLWTNVAHSGR